MKYRVMAVRYVGLKRTEFGYEKKYEHVLIGDFPNRRTAEWVSNGMFEHTWIEEVEKGRSEK